MNVTLEVPDELLPQLEQRVAAIVLDQLDREPATRWFNVERAADYLSTTHEAIRGLVKRRQLPVHRTPSGRLLFDAAELDAWVVMRTDAQLLTSTLLRTYNSGNNGNAPAVRQHPGAGHGGTSSMSVSNGTPKRIRVEGVPNLYSRPADGKYECGYTGSDGRWHIKTLAATTLTEAKRELHQLLGNRDRNEDVAPQRLTLNEVADEFFAAFESKVDRAERSERTLEIYRQRWNTHVRAALGRKRIQAVRSADVSRFLAELRRKRKSDGELLSNWTLRGILNVLNVVLEHAVKHEYVAGNPVRRLNGEKPPAKNRTKARILEVDQVARLIAHAPSGYRALLVTAIYTALRQSELLGLRWQDIDLSAGTLHVRSQLSRATRAEPARLIPLKTDAGERHIDLAPELSRELAKHRLASPFSSHEDFVFATETGNPVYYRNASARGLDKAADRAGLNPEGAQRLSFHDLRHTAITHLIRSGADAAQVSRFAGHSKVSTTLDLYVGEFERRKVNDSGTRLAAVYAGALE